MAYLNEIQLILKQLKPQLVAKYGIGSLGLFGSVVRNDFTEDSDIDIIVTFTKPIGSDFIILADELENKLNQKVDLVSRGGVKDRYLSIIEPEIVYV